MEAVHFDLLGFGRRAKVFCQAGRAFFVLTFLVHLFPHCSATTEGDCFSLTICDLKTEEADALLDIKARLAGASNLSSWINGSNPCDGQWYGVTCDNNEVVQLNLTAQGLVGPIPASIRQLVNLQSLDLSNNSISGIIPNEISSLKNLQSLNLTLNAFINESFPEVVLKLTNLRELRLDNNRFGGPIPEGIQNLHLLEQLWLGSNSLTAPIPAGLSTLSSLNTLYIGPNDLNTTLPENWSLLTNLTHLSVHNCKLSGPLPKEWGGKLTNLQDLRLYRNHLTGLIPESWHGLKSLVQWSLHYNNLTGNVPQWLSQLAKNNSNVNFHCNFLEGVDAPEFAPPEEWSGNCFDSTPDSHGKHCRDWDQGYDCDSFFKTYPLPPPPPPPAPPPSPPATPPSGFKSGSGHLVLSRKAIVGVVIGTILTAACLVGALWKYKKSTKSAIDSLVQYPKRGQDSDWEAPQGLRRFTLEDIFEVTKGFSEECKIGGGGFGKVYLAFLEDGKAVAIKRANVQGLQGTKEFRNELSLLDRFHHRNLVQIEGFCDEESEEILVYEYMKNGNLQDHLYGEQKCPSLNWYKRIEIAVSVAQGLEYMHSFADPPVIHRDVKPSNILLDENMTAKLADFGISKVNPELDTHVSTRPTGTAGYFDPEYFLRRQLTPASDVYGFGVVLLELITGQPAIDHNRHEEFNLVEWVKPRLSKGGIDAIIDPQLGPDYPKLIYAEIAELAIMCASFQRANRPTMQLVVSSLEFLLNKLTLPEYLLPSSVKTNNQTSKTDEENDEMAMYNASASVGEASCTYNTDVLSPR